MRTRGLAQLSFSGNIAATLRDSIDKIKAVVASEVPWGPVDKILIHALPSELPKFCPRLELPIALAVRILISGEEIDDSIHLKLNEFCINGCVALSGELSEVEIRNKCGTVWKNFVNLDEVWSFLLGKKEVPSHDGKLEPCEFI